MTEQLQNRDLIMPSLISRNARLLNSRPTNILERLEWLNNHQQTIEPLKHDNLEDSRLMSRFSLNERLQEPIVDEKLLPIQNKHDNDMKNSTEINKTTSVKNKEERQNLEVERVKVDCENLKIEIETIQSEMKKMTIQLSQFSTKQQEEERELEILEEQRNIKGRTYDLLEDGENNIDKLKNVIDTEKNKLINLANQWERHRAPLIKKYRDEREKYSAKAVSIN